MGMVESLFFGLTFCVERILTWVCCALVLIVLIFTILMLMVYGISVGYHYAQKELTDFAYYSRARKDSYALRTEPNDNANELGSGSISNEENVHSYEQRPVLELYQTQKPEPPVYRPPPETPIVLLATERPHKVHDLSSHDRALARKVIGRFRRSRNNIPTRHRHRPPFRKTLKHSNNTRSRGKTMAFT